MSDYEAVVADTPESLNIHYRLRYRVFCEERGFEDPQNFPTAKETDEYDDDSVHFLVRKRDCGECVAAVRLVQSGDARLPMEEYCKIDRSVFSRFKGDMAEVSRLLRVKELAIRPVNQTRHSEKVPNGGSTVVPLRAQASRDPQKRQNAQILRTALAAVFGYGYDIGVTYAVFAVSPALARVLSRLGMQLTAIGKPCEHRGLRIPFVATMHQAYTAIARHRIGRESNARYAGAYRHFSEMGVPLRLTGESAPRRISAWQGAPCTTATSLRATG